MQPRLAVLGGLLKRQFEVVDGMSERWQIVWPRQMKTVFFKIAHGGITGGHLGKKVQPTRFNSALIGPPGPVISALS